MEFWAENYFWWAAGLGILAWLLAGKLWSPKLHIVFRLPFALLSSVIVVSLVGSVLAFSVYRSAIGERATALFQDRSVDMFMYYLTVGGAETAVIWLLVLLVRVIQLSFRRMPPPAKQVE